MKLPFNIKLIVLSCFIIITFHGIFEIEENTYINTSKNTDLTFKLSSILILVLIGMSSSFLLLQKENNKLLNYGYLFYCVVGLFYITNYIGHKDLNESLFKIKRTREYPPVK